MLDLFERASFLWLLIPLGAWLGFLLRRQPAAFRDRRLHLRLLLRGAFFISLTFALAGLRWPDTSKPIQVVAAIDLSASIFDRATQAQAFEELATQLARYPETELGVVVFGKNAGSERAIKPIGSIDSISPTTSTSRNTRKLISNRPNPLKRPPSDSGTGSNFKWPDLLHPQAIIDPDASGIGEAIEFSRGLFSPERSAAQGIVLISDGLDTTGRAGQVASAINGSPLDLLVWPSDIQAQGDFLLQQIQLPQQARVGLGLPIEVTVATHAPTEVLVKVHRVEAQGLIPVGTRKVKIKQNKEAASGLLSTTIRIVDHPKRPGTFIYRASVEGLEGKWVSGDFKENNTLFGAVRVQGPSRWAVLARPQSTLAAWGNEPDKKPLGVELTLFTTDALPQKASAYFGFSGVIVDGLSSKELQDSGTALNALRQAVQGGASTGPSGGIGLLAVGGSQAFGAGQHPEKGVWESLLPVTFRPEDDRTRTILFIIDVSRSMDLPMGKAATKKIKIDFAIQQLGLAIQSLRPEDRVALIEFSGQARTVGPEKPSRNHDTFIEALGELKLASNTNFLPAFQIAQDLLEKDDAEEQLIILLSDGDQTPKAPPGALEAAIKKLCPTPPAKQTRRTTLYAFGIGTGSEDTNERGEKKMKAFASWGAGLYFPEFQQLAKRLKSVFNQDRKDLYTRTDTFRASIQQRHPILATMGTAFPTLSFRNRTKARGTSEVLLKSVSLQTVTAKGSRKPDPLLVLGYKGTSRNAVLNLSLEGKAGQQFLAPEAEWNGGKKLLAATLSWLEDRPLKEQDIRWHMETDAHSGDQIKIHVYARDPKSDRPLSGLDLSIRLTSLNAANAKSKRLRVTEKLLPIAPGTYHTKLAPEGLKMGVYRLELLRSSKNDTSEPLRTVREQFVTVPFPPELQRFGTDRNALKELALKAGGHSRMINLPSRDIPEWIDTLKAQHHYRTARPLLLILALLFLLGEVAARGMRSKKARAGA